MAMGKLEQIAKSPRGLSHTIYSMYDAGVRTGSLWDFEREFHAAVGAAPTIPDIPWLANAADRDRGLAGKDLSDAFSHLSAGKEDMSRKSKSMSRAENVRLHVRIVSHLYSSSFGATPNRLSSSPATGASAPLPARPQLPPPATSAGYVSAFLPQAKVSSILDGPVTMPSLTNASAPVVLSMLDGPGAILNMPRVPTPVIGKPETAALPESPDLPGGSDKKLIIFADTEPPPAVAPLLELSSFPVDLDDQNSSGSGSKMPSPLHVTPRASRLSGQLSSSCRADADAGELSSNLEAGRGVGTGL